jgi:hypothetical protein
MSRHSSPALLRYFLARCRPLAQVKFWAPVLGLIGLSVFAWQISQNPDWLEALGRDPAHIEGTQTAKEDLAIGADIDSLPLLMGDLGANGDTKGEPQSTLLPSLAKLTGNTPNLNQEAPIPSSGSFSLAGLLDKPAANPVGPLTGQSAGPMFGGASLADSTTRPAAPTSALSEAMARYSPIPASSVMAPNLGNNPGSTPANNYLDNYPSSYPAQGTAPIGQNTYNPVQPAAGVTGADPSNPNLPNAYTGLNTGFNTGLTPDSATPAAVAAPVRLNPGTGLPADAGIARPFDPVTQQQSTAPDVPFSTPRVVPGRILGNGQINTFSNP